MKILTRIQLKNAEDFAVKEKGETYISLMEKAGNFAADEIIRRYSVSGKKVLVAVGSGNNGGDGLVIAECLQEAGACVYITAPFGLPATQTAIHFYQFIENIPLSDNVCDADIYVDALFGIGLNKEIEGDAAKIIEDINGREGIKVAVDIPSGVYADGNTAKTVFNADLTVTFIGNKISQFLPATSSRFGETVLYDLGIDPQEYAYETIEEPIINKRDKNVYKTAVGTVFTVCGSYGICGASVLAAKAAYRSGAGVVKSVVCDKNYTVFSLSVPEAVIMPVATSKLGAPVIYEKTLLSGLSSSSACLIGCGLGRSEGAVSIVRKTLELTGIPTVVDADGINALATDINILRRAKAPLILTPHPAEMARLCGVTASEIERNRIKYATAFSKEYGCILVLKGANTIVASPTGKLYFNTTGNPGMATAGSGDVLAGVVVSLLAQGYDPLYAAKAAVFLHGKAGDKARDTLGERYMNASDIIKGLKE